MNTYLTVDIGGTKLAAALIKDGVIIERQQIETVSSHSPDVLRAALSDLLLPLSKKADCVAVASTGIISNGQLTALNATNLGGLNQFPLQSVIASITGLHTVVINDAQAAAWAEYFAYSEQYPNMAFITVSTGVGVGLVLNGKLLIGARGIASHAGHMLADPHGHCCGCGRIGCVESVASGRAIERDGEVMFGPNVTGRDIYQYYLTGHPDATLIIKRSASAIAQLIADLTIAVDLDAVVLGGGVGLANGYLSLVDEALSALPDIYHPPILPALCGTNAGLVGAAKWAESII